MRSTPQWWFFPSKDSQWERLLSRSRKLTPLLLFRSRFSLSSSQFWMQFRFCSRVSKRGTYRAHSFFMCNSWCKIKYTRSVETPTASAKLCTFTRLLAKTESWTLSAFSSAIADFWVSRCDASSIVVLRRSKHFLKVLLSHRKDISRPM